MKRKLRIIIIAFSASFLVMAGLSFYSMKQFETLILFSTQIEHTYQVIDKLNIVESTVKELDIRERGYIITRDSSYISGIDSSVSNIEPALQSLENFVSDNKKQQGLLKRLRSTLILRVSNLNSNISTFQKDSSKISPSLFHTGKNLKIECLAYIDKMRIIEDELLRERNENKVIYQRLTSNNIRYLLFIFCIVTATLFLVMISELKKRLASQEELQNKIIDVKRSHSELEQIAYASSHDLQEPLRKIQVFTDRFAWLRRNDMDEETSETIKRINTAALRMQDLIEDLADLTTLAKDNELKESTDLNRLLNSAITDLNARITGKDATIYKEVLPEIMGHPHQLHLMFKSLLDNSIKFSREDVKPLISIRSDKVSGDELIDINEKLSEKLFYRVTFSDNGIGFDNKFISKMFQIFQRLHNQQSEYEGKGVGLAICQRVMANHEGYIIAHGHPEVGATFKLFFPVNDA